MSVLVFIDAGVPAIQAITLARTFGGPVHGLPEFAVQPFAPDALAAILQWAAEDLDVTAVFAAGTERGNDVMARLAARTGLPLAANVTAATPGQPVRLTRQRWGGSLLEDAELHSPRPLITVAPHTFPMPDGGAQLLDVDFRDERPGGEGGGAHRPAWRGRVAG